MGHLVAIANMKGGVGKTTTTVSLAETLAAAGHRVLVVDLDAQANASIAISGKDAFADLHDAGRTVEEYFDANITAIYERGARVPIGDLVARDISPVSQAGEDLPISLLPCSPDLRYLERGLIIELTERGFGVNAIEGALARVIGDDVPAMRAGWDFTLFDCSPGISSFSEAAIRNVDLVIAPTIPDFISVQGLPQFCNYLAQAASRGDGRSKSRGLPPPVVLATRTRNTREHMNYLRGLASAADGKDPPFRLFDTTIPDRIGVAQALQMVESYPSYQEKWSVILDELDALARELREMLDAGAP